MLPDLQGAAVFSNVTDQGIETWPAEGSTGTPDRATDQGIEAWPIEGSTGAPDRPSQGRSTVLTNEASDPSVQAIR